MAPLLTIVNPQTIRDDSFIEKTYRKESIQLSEIYILRASTGEIKEKIRLNPTEQCPAACGTQSCKMRCWIVCNKAISLRLSPFHGGRSTVCKIQLPTWKARIRRLGIPVSVALTHRCSPRHYVTVI